MELLSSFVFFLLGAVTSWIIANGFHKKADRSLRSENRALHQRLAAANTWDHFVRLLDSDTWDMEYTDHQQVWTARTDRTCKIRISNDADQFDEPWTRHFPDPIAYRLSVYLSIRNVEVKQLLFISLDGARILVPLPKTVVVDGSPVYFWDMDSVSVKVAKVVDTFHTHGDLAGVARRCGVEWVEARREEAR